jgi:hypothetical protein
MRLIVRIIDRNSPYMVARTIVLEGKSLEEIKSEFEEIVSGCGFAKWYTDNEVEGEITDEVKTILEELDLMPD